MRTIVYEIFAALIQFASTAVAAYGLARFKIKGKGILTAIMILNILVLSMMIIIPSYVNFSYMDAFGIVVVLIGAVYVLYQKLCVKRGNKVKYGLAL